MIERLYTAHHQRLLRFCITLTGNPAQAEDIVQEAFLRVLAHADILQEMPEAKCLSWLFKTARNLFLDQTRRAARAPKDAAEGIFEPDLGAVHVAQWLAQQYMLIHVNGSVIYPDSLSGKLPMLRVNGSTECYPANAIRCAKRTADFPIGVCKGIGQRAAAIRLDVRFWCHPRGV